MIRVRREPLRINSGAVFFAAAAERGACDDGAKKPEARAILGERGLPARSCRQLAGNNFSRIPHALKHCLDKLPRLMG